MSATSLAHEVLDIIKLRDFKKLFIYYAYGYFVCIMSVYNICLVLVEAALEEEPGFS